MDSEKIRCLIQAVVLNSKVARAVQVFLATADNYDKAIQQIQKRFSWKYLVVQIYTCDFLTRVVKHAIAGGVKTDLPKLYVELEGKLRSFETLGRSQETNGYLLIPLVESVLPEEVLMLWERKL